MTGKTHQIIGLTAGLATLVHFTPSVYSPATVGFALAGAHIAALLPDIDQPASTIWRSFPMGRVLGEISNPFFQHRNITHSIVGTILAALGMFWLLSHAPTYWGVHKAVVLVVWLAAYLSHLLADMVTVQGIPVFFPHQHMYGIPPRPFQALRIETGQWFENFLIFPIVNLLFLALVWVNLPILKLMLFR
jgi:membrane-bound metal-dependent hydrolase YbcI (DUF457 family)